MLKHSERQPLIEGNPASKGDPIIVVPYQQGTLPWGLVTDYFNSHSKRWPRSRVHPGNSARSKRDRA